MPSGASSRRRASNAALRPRLDAAYIPTHAEGVIAPVDPMSTTSRRPDGAEMVNGVSHSRQRPDQVEVQQFSPHRRFAAGEGADHPAAGDGDDGVQAAQRVDRSRDSWPRACRGR